MKMDMSTAVASGKRETSRAHPRLSANEFDLYTGACSTSTLNVSWDTDSRRQRRAALGAASPQSVVRCIGKKLFLDQKE